MAEPVALPAPSRRRTWLCGALVMLAAAVMLVAGSAGVSLAPDYGDRCMGILDAVGANAYSSLHHDLVTGHRLELDALHGELTRRAARHEVPVPVSEMIYSLLRPWEVALG